MRWGWLLVVGCWAGCVADPAEVILERQQLEMYATNAQMYLENRDLRRARQQAEKALEIDDHYHKAKLILGNVLFLAAQGTSDLDERRAFLEEAEERLLEVADDAKKSDVSVFKAYFVLGELYHYKHLTALNESVRLEHADASPGDVQAFAEEAEVMLDLAVRHYQNALLTSRERFDAARARLVETLFDRGRKDPRGHDYDTALEQADLYIDKALTDQQVLRERLQQLPQQADLTEPQRLAGAQVAEARIKELHYNVVRMREQKARILARRKQWEPAATELELAIADEPEYSLLYHAHGLALAQSGALPRARTQLLRFGELRAKARSDLVEERERLANDPKAGTNAGREQLHRISAAIAEADRDQFRLGLTLAILECRLGLFVEARQHLDRILVDDPDSVAAALLAVTNAVEARQAARAEQLALSFERRLRHEYPDLLEVLQMSAELRRGLAHPGG